jgi:ribosome-binding protein aMBF1 (putative translation factor)
VWEGYFAAVGWWRDDALALLGGTRAVPKQRSKPPTKEKIQLAFGAAVRARREALSLTQEQLAELADLHTNYVSSVERGERNIGLHNVARLAYALDLPVSVLTSCLDLRGQ